MADNNPTGAHSLRGDHGVTRRFDSSAATEDLIVERAPSVEARPPDQRRERLEDELVVEAEYAAIRSRRGYLKRLHLRRATGGEHSAETWDRTNSPHTGLAISGGGIRSASFGLGALQGLNIAISNGVDGIDYLSTVSGGGYTGCALTAATQNCGETFPFLHAGSYEDTASIRHIRDFSNYLIPRGGLDVVTAIGIMGRGLVANVLLVAPVIFFCVWMTLATHPDKASLKQPRILAWNLMDLLEPHGAPHEGPLWGLSGFWFTVIILAIDLVFLALWAFWKSASTSQIVLARIRRPLPGKSAELQGGFARVSKILFFATLIAAWFEAQPFILSIMMSGSSASASGNCQASVFSPQCLGAILQGWIVEITPYLAPIGALIGFLSKYLGDVIAVARRSTGWAPWLKKITAKSSLWFAAIVMPSLLWFVYLELTFRGIGATPMSDVGWTAIIERSLFPTTAAWHAFGAFIATLLLALCINPNTTSLHRLYRDRLSKAFLFDPLKRDRHDDLEAVEPKLHEINTDLCPYPIINAALNIEGSPYANKRGRNADFFIFTPEYTGSDATGYVGTRRIEAEEAALDLGTAMAISGAAVSANMGSATIRPLSPTLALLNVRLGYWLRNPRLILGKRSLISQLLDFRSFLLFKEMFSLITETSKTVYLTDGGNIENLGIYSLLKRRCPIIIAVDAEADPTMSFGSFLTLERYARIDLGVIIRLPWQAIRDQALETNKAFDRAGGPDGTQIPAKPGPHCAAGEIEYEPGGERGILLYVKSSLSGDEDDYVLDYKRRNGDFPHETTGDQFFGEEQLEAYRNLGFHIMTGLLKGEKPFAVIPRPGETEADARTRILNTVREACGSKPLSPRVAQPAVPTTGVDQCGGFRP